ncbi:MAG TPA: phospholipase D family protein [Paludibacter sp.]
MAKFLTGHKLNAEIEEIFERAEEHLILISPYIKLHERYASTLSTKIDNHKLQITIVFGKNEDDISRSMKHEDFKFFKEFPNIEILYEKSLHAKYYANENTSILSSMNLYSYSQDNNIEAGVKTKSAGDDSFDAQAWEYFNRVIEQAELVFLKTPQYESKIMGLKKTYQGSLVEVDELTELFRNKSRFESTNRNGNYERIKVEQSGDSSSKIFNSGYCIRTGKPIPFNPKQPLSDDAFQNWTKYSNDEYPEKFCHYSGELSNGETSFSKPILRKNWNKAKTDHGF